ncbi:hypothetical protein [Candidatus Tisiphia endosymbiont of Ptychoptera albimana]|uniref:hypothetical protein n=1 Tax=Candidatus Tisiphia endosymbiont of Ptychoptera albimana TaxID=3066260 RepID=UPI00312C6E15
MGRINKYSNGDRVNQHRKSQGKFLEKQDIESYLLSNKLNNGNNIQETTPKIDALPDIPAILDYALNLPKQNNIDPLDGGAAHTPITQALLPFLTLFSAAFPNITAPPNKAIDNSNSSLSRVTSPTKVNTPVLFGTTPSTSQNHNQSKKLTKHSDDPSLIRKKDGLIRHDADGNIILGGDGKELTFSHNLDIKILKKQLTNNINITKLCLWALKIDPQEVQEIGEILKDSNVKELSILHGSIRNIGAIDFGTMLTGTKVTILNLPHNGIGNKVAKGLVKSLKETNVEVLDLSDNRIGNTGKGAKDIIKLLGETNVKALDLSNNNMSDEKVNKIIPELKENTKIIALGLKDTGIEPNTLKEVSKVLKQNKHVNKESTSTVESSTTEEKASTTEKKREKRDITDETLPKQESTVLTTDVSSTTTMKVTTSSPTEDSTTAKEETTVPTTKKSSTSTTESTTTEKSSTSTTEPATTEKSSTSTTEPTTTEKSSTSTTEPTTTEKSSTSTTEPTTTEKSSTITTEPTTTEKSSTSTTESTTTEKSSTSTTEPTTTEKSSTTTTKSTASSAGNPTTPKKNLTEKPEPIAADVVVDSITEKHTPKESNPNDPASSTMSTKEILALISFVLTAVSIGGGVAICVVKKFFDGASRLGHNVLALADLAESDNHLDNNEETSSLTGVTVNDDMD